MQSKTGGAIGKCFTIVTSLFCSCDDFPPAPTVCMNSMAEEIKTVAIAYNGIIQC